MYATLTPTGDFTVSKESPTLAALQGAVGGLIERVWLANGLDMWVNEEGKYSGLEPNLIATGMALSTGSIFPNDTIVGTVAFTGGADDEGETLGLSADQLKALRGMLDPAAKWALGRMMATGRIVMVGS